MAPSPSASPEPSIGSELERRRLALRLRRATAAAATLGERADALRRDPGRVPRQLECAIAGYEAEIAGIVARLEELHTGAAPRRAPFPTAVSVHTYPKE